jgi:hypothetical protein
MTRTKDRRDYFHSWTRLGIEEDSSEYKMKLFENVLVIYSLPSKTAIGASFVGSILVRIERNPGFIFTGSRGINCGTISFNVLSVKKFNQIIE